MSNTALLQRFERNTRGRDLIVGDIHGCFSRLQAALSAFQFHPDAGDRLFSVGDLVDRGPESHASLEWIAQPWFHAVQSNHEDMAIRWGKRDCQMDPMVYAANGGAWNIGNMPEERAEFSVAFDDLPIAIEIETSEGIVGIVHADCPFASWTSLRTALLATDLKNSERRHLRDMCMWDRSRIQSKFTGGVKDIRAVVVGHTPLERVEVLGNVYHIDTKGWHPNGKGFTLLNAATLTYETLPPQELLWEAA